MNPDKFREARIKINELWKSIAILAGENNAEEAKKEFSRAGVLIDKLTPKAEGEIQERSVKNLGIRLKTISVLIDKIKAPKKKAAPLVLIDWNEERLSSLPANYLSKVLANMGIGEDSQVCFSAIGKGIKSSYQIDFGNGESSAFSGSSHKPLKKNLPTGTKKVSEPFSFSIIKSMFDKK